jgi:hypothetical protein
MMQITLATINSDPDELQEKKKKKKTSMKMIETISYCGHYWGCEMTWLPHYAKGIVYSYVSQSTSTVVSYLQLNTYSCRKERRKKRHIRFALHVVSVPV